MSDGLLIAIVSSGLLAVSAIASAVLARQSHRDGGLETRAQKLERENRALNDYATALRAEARRNGHDPLPWPDQLTE